MPDNKFIVKVCGMTDAGNIKAVMAAGADWTGLVFNSESPTCVKMRPAGSAIVPDYSIFTDGNSCGLFPSAGLEENNRRMMFGVFKDDMAQNIITRIVRYHLDAIQLDGDESPVLIRNIRRSIVPDITKDIKVMKTIRVCHTEDLDRCEAYAGCADYFLFDMPLHDDAGKYGCNVFEVLSEYSGDVPFLIGGNIGYDDAGMIMRLSHPRCIGVNIGMNFETGPGMKDATLIKSFIDRIRKL